MKSTFLVVSIVLGGGLFACSSDDASGPGTSESAIMEAEGRGLIVASAEFVAKDGREDAVKTALENVERDTAREVGVRYSNVHQSVEDPKQFLALGVWRDRAAFEAHGRSKHAAAFSAAVSGLLADAPKARVYVPVGALDLARMNETARDPNALYTFVVAGTTTESAKEHVLDRMPGVIPVSRAQAGSRFYDILDASEPTTFASYESWTGAAAEQAHLASAPITQFLAEVTADLSGPPAFRHYKSIPVSPYAQRR